MTSDAPTNPLECASCGAALRAGARFCDRCGTPVEVEVSEGEESGTASDVPSRTGDSDASDARGESGVVAADDSEREGGEAPPADAPAELPLPPEPADETVASLQTAIERTAASDEPAWQPIIDRINGALQAQRRSAAEAALLALALDLTWHRLGELERAESYANRLRTVDRGNADVAAFYEVYAASKPKPPEPEPAPQREPEAESEPEPRDESPTADADAAVGATDDDKAAARDADDEPAADDADADESEPPAADDADDADADESEPPAADDADDEAADDEAADDEAADDGEPAAGDADDDEPAAGDSDNGAPGEDDDDDDEHADHGEPAAGDANDDDEPAADDSDNEAPGDADDDDENAEGGEPAADDTDDDEEPAADDSDDEAPGDGDDDDADDDEDKKADDGRPSRKSLLVAAAFLLSVGAWIGVGVWLSGYLPEREFQQAVSDVREGPQVLRGVAWLCEQGDDGRRALLDAWLDADDDRRDLLARAMLDRDCIDVLPDDARETFDLRHASWRLDKLAADPTEARGLLADVLADGDDTSRARAAELLIEGGFEGVSEERQARVLGVVRASPDAPWALDLLDALDSPAATALLVEWWDVERARSGLPSMMPPPPEPAPSSDEDDEDESDDDDGGTEESDAPPPPPPDPLAGWDLDAPADPVRLSRLERLVHAHWSQLAPARQRILVDAWFDAGWVLRKNASVTQVQPVMVQATWTPPPLHGPLKGAVAVVSAVSLVVDEEIPDLDGRPVAEHIGGHVFDAPGTWDQTVDITSIIDKHGRWQLGGTVEIALLPVEAAFADDVLDAAGRLTDDWRTKALYTAERTVEPFTYRVYINPELGLPDTLKDDEVTEGIVDAVEVAWRSVAPAEAPDEEPTVTGFPLHTDGARATAERPVHSITHGAETTLLVGARGELPADLSLRIQGRTKEMPPDAWIDLGESIVRAVEVRPLPDGTRRPPARIDLDLEPVCPSPGSCRFALRMRPSLLVARPDPRVEAYWGGFLELGVLEVDVTNAAHGHQWPTIQARLRGVSAAGSDTSP